MAMMYTPQGPVSTITGQPIGNNLQSAARAGVISGNALQNAAYRNTALPGLQALLSGQQQQRAPQMSRQDMLGRPNADMMPRTQAGSFSRVAQNMGYGNNMPANAFAGMSAYANPLITGGRVNPWLLGVPR